MEKLRESKRIRKKIKNELKIIIIKSYQMILEKVLVKVEAEKKKTIRNH